jgi:hypothetical protein
VASKEIALIIEIMAIITVDNHAHDLPFRLPHEVTRLAIPRASVNRPKLTNIAEKPEISTSANCPNNKPKEINPNPIIVEAIPLMIIRIAMIMIPRGRFFSNYSLLPS